MDAVDHLVLGAGPVEMAVAEALVPPRRTGARRQPPARADRGVQSVAGDVRDRAFAASPARGARVVWEAPDVQGSNASRAESSS
jgi:hypothetical protein